MANRLDITNAERAQITREIENFGMFIEDVVADPSILDRMPDEAHVNAIPIEKRNPARHYDVETPRTVATLGPARQEAAAGRTPTSGGSQCAAKR